MNSYPEILESRCRFMEICFAANRHCDEKISKTCYQAEIMEKKLKQARDLACPEAPNLKCDCPEIRALLSDPEKCTSKGKCIVRQCQETKSSDFNKSELFVCSSEKKLRGLNFNIKLRSLSV